MGSAADVEVNVVVSELVLERLGQLRCRACARSRILLELFQRSIQHFKFIASQSGDLPSPVRLRDQDEEGRQIIVRIDHDYDLNLDAVVVHDINLQSWTPPKDKSVAAPSAQAEILHHNNLSFSNVSENYEINRKAWMLARSNLTHDAGVSALSVDDNRKHSILSLMSWLKALLVFIHDHEASFGYASKGRAVFVCVHGLREAINSIRKNSCEANVLWTCADANINEFDSEHANAVVSVLRLLRNADGAIERLRHVKKLHAEIIDILDETRKCLFPIASEWMPQLYYSSCAADNRRISIGWRKSAGTAAQKWVFNNVDGMKSPRSVTCEQTRQVAISVLIGHDHPSIPTILGNLNINLGEHNDSDECGKYSAAFAAVSRRAYYQDDPQISVSVHRVSGGTLGNMQL